jgi:hypothetical protein
MNLSARKQDPRSRINAKNVELYSSAYRMAWKCISPLQKRIRPDLPLWLHHFIRHEIKEGATDPSAIALKAIVERGKSDKC